MDKGFAVLEIDPEFKTLIRPLRKDEYLQLEVNLAVDGCREPIITWNNIIVDGHNRYEICNRLHIPYAIREMPFENREQAIVWICSNQLGRRNITEETRRYLIGKQYELEKVARKHPPNINGFNQYKRRNKGERGDTFRRTAQKFSAQYNVSTGSVQKYAIFSKALDVVGQADPELPGKVLSGTFKISHENLVALSKMPPEEIRRIGSKPEDLQHPFTSYSDTRKEFADTDEEPVESMQETFGDQLRDETFKERVGFMSVRQLSRIAKERGAGSLCYAEAMLVAYNRKCKYTLRMTKLHSGKVAAEDDFVEENEEPLADDPVLEE